MDNVHYLCRGHKRGNGKDFIVGGWQVCLAVGRCTLHAAPGLPIHLLLVPWLEFHDAVCYFARNVLLLIMHWQLLVCLGLSFRPFFSFLLFFFFFSIAYSARVQ